MHPFSRIDTPIGVNPGQNTVEKSHWIVAGSSSSQRRKPMCTEKIHTKYTTFDDECHPKVHDENCHIIKWQDIYRRQR